MGKGGVWVQYIIESDPIRISFSQDYNTVSLCTDFLMYFLCCSLCTREASVSIHMIQFEQLESGKNKVKLSIIRSSHM